MSEEDQHDADVQQQADVLDPGWCLAREAVQQLAEPVGDVSAPSPYGKLPVAAPAPRNRNIDSMTKKIISSTSQAPPRCEPSNRDLRPSFSGAFLRRMPAKTASPTRQP